MTLSDFIQSKKVLSQLLWIFKCNNVIKEEKKNRSTEDLDEMCDKHRMQKSQWNSPEGAHWGDIPEATLTVLSTAVARIMSYLSLCILHLVKNLKLGTRTLTVEWMNSPLYYCFNFKYGEEYEPFFGEVVIQSVWYC